MRSYKPETYGEAIADVYDSWYQNFDPTLAVDFLAELAQGGPALELGIGTGRVALPLQERGVEVHGIDASPAMVAKLRAKPGGERIPVTMGDFADVAVGGQFKLIFICFNTLFALLTQEEQLRCFVNAAGHLQPDGFFAFECFVPDLARFHGGQTLRTVSVGDNDVRIDATQHDLANQRIISQHIQITPQGNQLYPVQIRYAWPSELDLMARLACLRLVQRWGGWEKSPYNSASVRHVSVYQLSCP